MRTLRMIVLVAAALAVLAAFAVKVDPVAAVKELNDLRTQRIADARAAGTPLDIGVLNAEILGKAKGYVEGVDPATVEPGLGYAWAQLFTMAEDHSGARTAAQRFVSMGDPGPAEKLQAQTLILTASNSLGDGAAIARTLREMKPGNTSEALPVARSTAAAFVPTIARALGADETLKLLGEVEAWIDYAVVPEAQADALKGQFALARADVLIGADRKEEGLRVLEKALEDLGSENAMGRRIASTITQKRIIGSPAPEIAFENKYGEFTSLADLRGKVVILSFFAHW